MHAPRLARPFAPALFARFALLALLGTALPLAIGCKDDKGGGPGKPQGSPPPSSTTPAPGTSGSGAPGAAAAASKACEPSVSGIDDAKLAALLPAQIEGFCAQKSGVESFGEGTTKKVENITDVIDGGGDIYVHAYFAKRWDRLKFHTGQATNPKAEVEVTISAYERPENAFGFFAERAVSDADPDPEVMAKQQRRPLKPIAVAGVGALGKGHAILWRDKYLVELDYIDDDAAPDELVAAADRLLPKFVQAIDAKIGGGTQLPLDVVILPGEVEGRIPFGVEYVPPKYTRPQGKSQGLALAIPAGWATAYMKGDGKRWRVIAVTRDEKDAAKDALGAFRKFEGAVPVKEVGDEAVYFTFPVTGGAANATKAEGVAGREGGVVIAVIDEEQALGDPSAKGPYPRLSKDEKIARLKVLLATKKPGNTPIAAPSTSASAPAASASAPKK
jgi:hypothetical protein